MRTTTAVKRNESNIVVMPLGTEKNFVHYYEAATISYPESYKVETTEVIKWMLLVANNHKNYK